MTPMTPVLKLLKSMLMGVLAEMGVVFNFSYLKVKIDSDVGSRLSYEGKGSPAMAKLGGQKVRRTRSW